eukprot:TRINITY_DN69574_c0_g3_i1.p1 TRINITY_DN69574_c0_g3~~TRINITY_DN69574_c0_g3_i1.p1  ORF type:complete len:659 (+),score=135.39 TRINITY_DN69574_c0_g3_i1:184-2160(+)
MNDLATDLGVVCRLAHEHLPEIAHTRNDVLRKLPHDFRGDVDGLVKDIPTSIEVPPIFRNSTSALAHIYQTLVQYQLQQGHHQPASRLQRMTNYDNFHAKRIICELLKTFVSSYQTADDTDADAQETEGYYTFATHLLYYHDRWSGKVFSDPFASTLVVVTRKLDELQRVATEGKHKYLRILERMYENCEELLDHALRVTVLAVTDHHPELEELTKKHGPISLKLLSQPMLRNSSAFWCTDYGLVVQASLIRADPSRFRPQGVIDEQIVPANVRHWSVWTDELGTIKMYEYKSLEEAKTKFDKSMCCVVLVGPEGKLQQKNFSSNQLVSSFLSESAAMKELIRRVEQYLTIQKVASAKPSSAPSRAPRSSQLQQLCDSPTVKAIGNSELGSFLGVSTFENEVENVRKRWNDGYLDTTGIAEPFRGGRKVKWVQGVFEKESKSSDFPAIILDLPRKLSDLLMCHVEVMGALRSMIAEGGSKEALAAIFALRQRGTITGRLALSIEQFVASATLVHGFFQSCFFKGIEEGKKTKGQVPSMQRVYFESFRAVSALHSSIMTQWHQLGMKISDKDLSDEARRIDFHEREAFAQLMGMPQAVPMLGAIGSGYGNDSQPKMLQDSGAPAISSFRSTTTDTLSGQDRKSSGGSGDGHDMEATRTC